MRQKIVAIAGIVVIALIVLFNPYSDSRPADSFTNILHQWGEEQEATSEMYTSQAVSGVEGTLVGEHQVKGANWSIPNILRFWIERWTE